LRPDLEPSAQDRAGPVEAGPEEATKMVRGMEHLSCEERLSLEKRRLLGHLSSLPAPEGVCRKAGEGLFTRACSDRTRGNGF